MGAAGVPGHLLLRAFLVLLGLRQLPPSLHLRRSEEAAVVVVPQRVTPRGRAGPAEMPGALSYVLPLDGQSRLLRLHPKKLLLAPRLPVFTYTDGGALAVDQPFVPDDCYYHGYVEGTPESLVALSTCSGGLRGMLQVGPLVYEIEPLPASRTFEHLVSRSGAGEPSPMKCGLTDDLLSSLRFPGPQAGNVTPRQGPMDGWWTHSRFLELAVVVDHRRFVYSRRNETKVREDVVNVVNVVDSLYQLLNLKVSLVGIEIWTQRNLVDTDASIYEVLKDFSLWKLDSLSGRLPHDCAHLLVGRRFAGVVGLAFVGGICDPRASSAVDAFVRDRLLPAARTVAHELGHNLGMAHDFGSCSCRRKLCVMHAFLSDANVFSNCSYRNYFSTITQRGLCLVNAPPAEAVFRLERCGNRVVERGEECDCGPPGDCKWDLCCRTDCRLRAGAVCASGPCCSDCRIAPAGKLCRPQSGECDLPEWCDGASAGCPEDVFKQDGTPCGQDARCYRKWCGDRDGQCRALFGPEARGGPRACYEEVNVRGDRFGHCGLWNWLYHKCQGDDVLCGRVQCRDVQRLPALADHTTVVQTALDGVTCWGTDYHVGMGIPDVGDVKDGTACGPGGICVGRRCVGLATLRYDCEAERCHSRGVCNSKRNCHCHFGWAPPHCATRGFGGSIDSGPAAPDRLLPTICFILYTLAVFALFFLGTVFHPSLGALLRPRPGRGERRKEAGRSGWRSYLRRMVHL
ncbi:disintegrin and metalloproteinase domain-containing protein 21-like [Ornithorhynchus anatinus]|uniref:disintegrin and metalloproteinase domain-containing protein 21-like n=1 Tax=Ornithorhynchus anatinus TaxID=9258 RepID=UPI0010A8C03D|nr:disintegrin and metalloproteinase domain-containing protein 21-like [Ornithorhynchus anatinus]